MSIEIKQKIKEVADDFGMPAKNLIEIVGKFYDKPKSSSQNLTEEQQMLAVGRALMAKPKLVMMDEPSLGLAPLVVKGIFDIIKEINRQGITVLLIEQNANMALKVADWAYVMQTGSILMDGPGEELAANEEVKAAYLGTAK